MILKIIFTGRDKIMLGMEKDHLFNLLKGRIIHSTLMQYHQRIAREEMLLKDLKMNRKEDKFDCLSMN